METLTDDLAHTIKRFHERTYMKKHACDVSVRRITVVHILYNSYPTDFIGTDSPSDFLCWPLLANTLSMKYIEDKDVKLTHIILNIDKRYGVITHELTCAIEKHIASIQLLYPMVDFHYKNFNSMFFSPAALINQIKLLSTTLPSDLMYNVVYFGNYSDLQTNPFQLTKHHPRIFAPPYDNNINYKHMFADIMVTAEMGVCDVKWKTGNEWRFYELKEYRIPALLELIQPQNRKCYCPVTKNALQIYDLFELPLTRASARTSPRNIVLIKTYLQMIFIDSNLAVYIDSLIDEIIGLCMTDVLRIYILQVGGTSGFECFEKPISVIAVLLLHAVKQYMMLPPGRAEIYTPVIGAIASRNEDDLIRTCTNMVDQL
jgi:hypothetical protein